MLSGNKNTDREILLKLKDHDVMNYCNNVENRFIYKEVCNDSFFHNYMIIHYPNVLKYKTGDMTWKQYYLKTIWYISKMKEESDFEFKTGDPKEYYDILHNNLMSHIFFERVGEINAKDLYEIYSKKSSDANTPYTMKGAAKINHEDFIEYLIKEGRSYKNNLLNLGLEGATEANNMDLINFFIDKGADNFKKPLRIAAKNGNINLIDFFLDKDVNDLDVIDLNQSMFQAATENRKNIIDYLIEKGANDNDNLHYGMIGAAKGGNLNLLKYIIGKAKGMQVDKWFFERLLREVSDGKRISEGRMTGQEIVNGEKKYDEVINFLKELKERILGKKN